MRVSRKSLWLNAARLAVISLVLVAIQVLAPAGGANAIAGQPSDGFKFGTNAINNDTADGYLVMSNGFHPGSDKYFTAEAWVYSENYSIDNAVVLLGAFETETPQNQRALSIKSVSATDWKIDISGWAGMTWTFPAMANSTWHHVAVVGDDNGIRFWLDGQKSASAVSCGNCTAVTDGNYQFTNAFTGTSTVIGGWPAGGQYYSSGGVLSSLRLSDVARYSTTAATIPIPSGPLSAVDANTKLLLNNPVTGTTPVDTSLSPQTLTLGSRGNIVNFTSQNPNELVTFDKQNNSSSTTSAVARNSYATATDPTWYGYNFKGWAETSMGVVRNLSTVAITGAKTFYGIWEQKSSAGTGTLPTPNTLSPHPTNDQTVSTSRGTTSTSVKVPAGALPSTYSVKVYTLPDNDLATQTLGANNTYIISQIVAWSDTANGSVGNIQDTAVSKPIEMTITSPDIKIGAKVYSLLGNVSTLLATATQDGSVIATFSVDPVIVVQAAPVAGSSGGGSSVATPSPAPTASKPPVITSAKSFNVLGFNPGSWKLTKSIKKSIDSFFKSINKPSKISCVGYTMGPTVLRADYNLAMRRGQEVCNYVVAKNPTIAKMTTKGTTTKNSDGKYRRATINWND